MIHTDGFQTHHQTCIIDMVNKLKVPFTKEVVFHDVKNLKSNVAPGPDGIPSMFNKSYW